MALTLTLQEAKLQHTAAIKAVQEAAVDYDETESGTWTKSQTYAVFLNALQEYEIISRAYHQALAQAVLKG